MLGTSEYADNLFLRLSSYSQRRDREPLEDFCSEALVWCLRQSVTFRQGFFKLSQLDFLRRNADAIAIHSQQRFEEEGDDNATERKDIRGRFDIVFETPDSSLFVALESKVGAGFGSNQIEKYLRRLESLKKSNPEVQCALITLTNLREGPVENARNVRHLFWGDVHNELEVASRAKPNAGKPRMLLEILRQFAGFLK